MTRASWVRAQKRDADHSQFMRAACALTQPSPAPPAGRKDVVQAGPADGKNENRSGDQQDSKDLLTPHYSSPGRMLYRK